MRAKSATAAIWAERVREWRASGETALVYGARQGYSGKCLHTWASRLKAARRRMTMQLVRVDRVAASAPTANVAARSAARLHIELGDAWRVAVEPGFDRATLAAIVEVLAPLARGAR